MKKYRGVETQVHAFLIVSTPDCFQWPAWRPGRFVARGNNSCIFGGRIIFGPRGGLSVVQKIKFLAPTRKRTPFPRSSNPYSAHYIYKNCLVAVTRSSSSGWRPVIEIRSMQYAAGNAVPLFRLIEKCVSYRLYPGIRSELSFTPSRKKWLRCRSLA